MKYQAISADSHINEPPDLWVRRLPAKYRDRAPHVIDTPSGANAWVVEDAPKPFPLGFNAVNYRAQKRYDRYEYRKKFEEYRIRGVRFEDILPGSFDPDARVREMDEDHVDAELLYNGAGLWPAVKNMKDREFVHACFLAYNDWMAEFQAHDPARLIGIGAIPSTGIDDAIAELERCVHELKLRTVCLESYPSGSFSMPSPVDDRFWGLAQELGVPVAVHISFNVPAGGMQNLILGKGPGNAGRESESGPAGAAAAGTRGGSDFRSVLRDLILTGVFDRFPRLKFVGAEVHCGWIPYYFEQFDDAYRRYHHREGISLELLPYDYFKRNVHVTFILDQVGVDNRYLYGVENAMWSSDFPHSVSNWPIDVVLANEQMDRAGAPPGERERMMWRNCAKKLYGLSSATNP